jgi:hypothetical protein
MTLNILTCIAGKDKTCNTPGGKRETYNIFVVKPYGENHFRALGVDGRKILNRILEDQDVKVRTGFI